MQSTVVTITTRLLSLALTHIVSTASHCIWQWTDMWWVACASHRSLAVTLGNLHRWIQDKNPWAQTISKWIGCDYNELGLWIQVAVGYGTQSVSKRLHTNIHYIILQLLHCDRIYRASQSILKRSSTVNPPTMLVRSLHVCTYIHSSVINKLMAARAVC